MKTNYSGIALAWLVTTLFLTACGGSGSGSGGGSTATPPPPPPPTYTIGGTLTGLATGNNITLANNGADNITITANGSFTFPTTLINGTAYNISIVTLPNHQLCTSTYGAGTVTGADVTNINISCTGSWSSAGSLPNGLVYHTATMLLNGKVIVAGGVISGGLTILKQTQLYDPSNPTLWPSAAWLNTARYSHTATLLANGMVLVAGGTGASGVPLASVELYGPTTNTWSAAASLANTRVNHTATLLSNGKVLVVGGAGAGVGVLASAELYDPVTNAWTAAGTLTNARFGHTATLLPNGKVLVAGGCNCVNALASVELYDPATNAWSSVASLNTARTYHTATLLTNGMVLVAGGEMMGGVNGSGVFASSELYDPSSNTWSAAGNLATARFDHTATLLTNGMVLVAGGVNGAFVIPALATAELYNPATNTWSATGSLANARYLHTATLLSTGKVLVVGGDADSSNQLSSAELYW